MTKVEGSKNAIWQNNSSRPLPRADDFHSYGLWPGLHYQAQTLSCRAGLKSNQEVLVNSIAMMPLFLQWPHRHWRVGITACGIHCCVRLLKAFLLLSRLQNTFQLYQNQIAGRSFQVGCRLLAIGPITKVCL